MKTTGIVRRIDDLGRVIIPKEIRRSLCIRDGDPLEIFVEDNMVCFKKYHEYENICQSLSSLIDHIKYDNLCDEEVRDTAIASLNDLYKYIKKEQSRHE